MGVLILVLALRGPVGRAGCGFRVRGGAGVGL